MPIRVKFAALNASKVANDANPADGNVKPAPTRQKIHCACCSGCTPEGINAGEIRYPSTFCSVLELSGSAVREKALSFLGFRNAVRTIELTPVDSAVGEGVDVGTVKTRVQDA
jgi:hypothetical protein